MSLILGVITDWWWHHPCSSTSWGKWEENTFVTFRPDREGNRDRFVDMLSWQLALCHCHTRSGEKCPEPGNKIHLPPLKMMQISRMHIFDWHPCKNKNRKTYSCFQNPSESHLNDNMTAWGFTPCSLHFQPPSSVLVCFSFHISISKFAHEGSFQKPSLAAN